MTTKVNSKPPLILKAKKWLLALIGISFCLLIYGAVPYQLAAGVQSYWAMGFSASIGNNGFLSLYPANIGVPNNAPMAFGLPAALIGSLLFKTELNSATIYSITFALFLSLSYASIIQISQINKVNYIFSNLIAILWLTSAQVRAHSEYSMLSLGIALLPAYMLPTVYFLKKYTPKTSATKLLLLFFFQISVSIVSIFMDGYSFIFFFVASTILTTPFIFALRTNLFDKLKYSAAHLSSFFIAYCSYSIFTGKSGFKPHSLNSFRGWGADVSFFMLPKKGIYWIFDTLNLNNSFGDFEYWGDGSVSNTTFILQYLVIITILIIFWRTKTKEKSTKIFFIPIIITSMFAIYMSLGPSLKYNFTKTSIIQSSSFDVAQVKSIRKERGINNNRAKDLIPTGSFFINKYMPGFNVMRSTYRWIALFVFSVILLMLLTFSSLSLNQKKCLCILVVFSIFLQLPNMPNQMRIYSKLYINHNALINGVVSSLSEHTDKYDVVAFLPWDNDMPVNLIAALANIKTPNIGGDKNIKIAQEAWPKRMVNLGGIKKRKEVIEKLKEPKYLNEFYFSIIHMLKYANITKVVIPYYQPQGINCNSEKCLKENSISMKPLLSKIGNNKELHMEETPYFSIIDLKNN